MKSKLEKILAQCSFLSDEQLSTIRNNGTLFDTIPPSKGFLRRLSENAMSFDEKLDLLNYLDILPAQTSLDEDS